MESANLHLQHQSQEQFAEYSPLQAAHQSGHKAPSSKEWKRSIININLNGSYSNIMNENFVKSTDSWPTDPSIITSTNQNSFSQHSATGFLLANIRDEMSDSFPKLISQMAQSPSHVEGSYLLPKKQHHPHGENQWHSNFSLGNHTTKLQLSSSVDDVYPNADDKYSSSYLGSPADSSRFNFSQHQHIFPSANIQSSDLYSTLFPSTFGLNLKALDLLSSSCDHGGSSGQYLHDNPGKLSTSFCADINQMREYSDGTRSTCSSNKVADFGNGSGMTRTKRPASFSESSKESHSAAKKCRPSMSRSPCPTQKVRKEKLGDRISALQKLVAPFGKTDTASVLTEAIGYIQFLHDQVQTLSVPYMNSSQSRKTCRKLQLDSGDGEGKEEPKRDLRSRGLCLVPQSCASYFIHSYSNGMI